MRIFGYLAITAGAVLLGVAAWLYFAPPADAQPLVIDHDLREISLGETRDVHLTVRNISGRKVWVHVLDSC